MANPNVAFYVTAHQDDWQFFRGEQAYQDLTTGDTRIVFIYTTAGDDKMLPGWWEAREKGAIASIRKAIPAAPLLFNTADINGHRIAKFSCGNSVSYCLRLPDNDAPNSLENLRAGVISSLRSVDDSAVYRDWEDFVFTLKAILAIETLGGNNAHPWVNAPDYNATRNPGDHADHKATADALQTFVSEFYNRAWWATYDTSNRSPNLSGSRLAQKRAMFDAYSNEVLSQTTANGVPHSPNETEWNWWGDKSYVTLRAFNTDDD